MFVSFIIHKHRLADGGGSGAVSSQREDHLFLSDCAAAGVSRASLVDEVLIDLSPFDTPTRGNSPRRLPIGAKPSSIVRHLGGNPSIDFIQRGVNLIFFFLLITVNSTFICADPEVFLNELLQNKSLRCVVPAGNDAASLPGAIKHL